MKFGRRFLSCFLSFTMAVTMMCGCFTATAAAENSVSDRFLPHGDVVPLTGLPVDEEQLIRLRESDAGIGSANDVETDDSSVAYNFSSNTLYKKLNTNEKALYDAMDSACRSVLNSTDDYSGTVDFGSYGIYNVIAEVTYVGIDTQRASDIQYAFKYSNPQYYFISNTYGYGTNSIILLFGNANSHDFSKYSERAAVQNALDDLTEEWMTDISKISDIVEQEDLINHKVCEYLEYDYAAQNNDDLLSFDQTLASCILNQKTVCAGYSMLTAYFCNAAGLECFAVSKQDCHQWNLIRLYDNWYQLDNTFNDTGKTWEWVNKSYDTFQTMDKDGDHVYSDFWFTLGVPDTIYDTVQIPDGPKTITEISVTAPSRTSYIVGEELDLTGGKITVSYNYGDPDELALDAEGVTITGYNKTKTGKQTITVGYKGFTATFDVTVSEKQVKSITVTAPTKKTYISGDDLDLTGGKISVSYNYGDPDEIALDAEGVTITGYNKTKTGKQTITVGYKGFTDTFDVTVSEKQVKSITVTAPTKTTYISGDDLDLTGGKITVSYNYGDPDELALDAEGVTITGYNKTKTGKQTITVSYRGEKATFVVTVEAKDPDTPGDNSERIVIGEDAPTIEDAVKYINTAIKNDTAKESYIFVIDREITEKKALALPKGSISVVLISENGGKITLLSPKITTNCDLTIECDIASDKPVTINVAKDRTLTINKSNAKIGSISGTKTSRLIAGTDITVETIKNFASINTDTNVLTITKSFSGAAVANATLAYDFAIAKKISVSDITGTLNIAADNIESGTTIFQYTGKTDFNGSAVQIGDGTLTAFAYKKDIRAMQGDALTVGEKNYPDFEKAFEEMNASEEYIVTLNTDISVDKLTLPKSVKKLTVDGKGHTLKAGRAVSLAPSYALVIENLKLIAKKNDVLQAVTLNAAYGIRLDSVEFEAGTVNIKGKGELTLRDCTGTIASIKGFDTANIDCQITITKALTVPTLKLGSKANITLSKGASITARTELNGADGAVITFGSGAKTITATGVISGKIILTGTLPDSILKVNKNLSTTDLNTVFSVDGKTLTNSKGKVTAEGHH